MNKKPLTRNCPTCGNLIVYKSRESCRTGERKNSDCRTCGTKKQYINDPYKNIGDNNGRYGKTLLNVMINKYGDIDGTTKYAEWQKNVSLNDNKFKPGIDNPQYGKNTNLKSGMSYKGYYKGLFFRSSFELMFIYDYFRKYNILPITADNNKFKVEYFIGEKVFNYFPDYYCNINKTVFEIKSFKFSNTTNNISKREYAVKHFNNINIHYKLLTENDLNIYIEYGKSWQRIIYDFMYNLYLNSEIDLLDISIKKLKNSFVKKNMLNKLNELTLKGK